MSQPSPQADSAIERQAQDEMYRLWLVFVESSTRAQRTLVFADGMVAREAWARFMTAYAPPQARRTE